MCPTQSHKKVINTALIPSKIFDKNIVGRGTEIFNCSIDISTYEYFTGQKSIIYKYLLSCSQPRHNLYSISIYMVKPDVIKKDSMTHTHEKYLLKTKKYKDAALEDHLLNNNNKILSDPDTIMNNVKEHISKSEEENEKIEFNMKTLKNLTKNWNTVKKYVLLGIFYLLILIFCCWNLIYR